MASTLDLSFSDHSAETIFTSAVATGAPFVNATLKSVSDDGKVNYQTMDIGNFLVNRVNENTSGFSASLTYSKLDVTTYNLATGSANPVFSYDFITGKSGANLVATDTPGTQSHGSTHPDHYFMLAKDALSGTYIPGNSMDKYHTGWLEIADFSTSFENPVTIGSSGIGVGKTQNNGITIEFSNRFGADSFLKMAAAGTHFENIQIEGVNSFSGANPLPVYELNLGIVGVSEVRETSGGAYAVTLKFGKYDLRTQSIDAKGDLAGDNAEARWDFEINKTGDGVPMLRAFEAFSSNTVNTSTTTAPQPVHYFLALSGVSGSSTDTNHKGWFDVDNFSADAQNVLNIGSASGGVGAGKATHLPLELTINGRAGINQLLQNAADKMVYSQATVQGIDGSGHIVYSMGLGTVAMTSLTQTSNDIFSVSLDYGAIKTQTGDDLVAHKNETGAFEWNFLKNTTASGITTNAVPGAATSSATPTHFYINFGVGHNYELDSFQLSADQLTSLASPWNAGKLHFSPASINMNMPTDSQIFRDSILKGEFLDDIKIFGT